MKSVVLLIIAAFVIGAFADVYQTNVTYQGNTFEHFVTGVNGGVKFISNFESPSPLGTLVHDEDAPAYIQSINSLLGLTGTEVFRTRFSENDTAGHQHIRLQQFNRGLEVDGGELIIHVNGNTRNVFALTVSVLADTIDASNPLDHPQVLFINAAESAPLTIAKVGEIKFLELPELVYLIHDDEGYLAYRALIEFAYADGIPQREFMFVCARTGKLIVEDPLYMTALNRAVYSANQGTSLPGTLKRSEGQPTNSDLQVNEAYDNSGICYNYFKAEFNRDSIDNRGAKLTSTVHYSSKYNNAFWDGFQMVYGDGDGVNFSNFAGDISVVCHELTHAVTSYSANLRYQGESGALNEAMSDIFAAAVDIWQHDGSVSSTSWLIGHECYLVGQALRYMNNPILDGSSKDYYPLRYTGSSDNGGVHWNSGIANLWYVLLVQGGVHPQQRTTNWVNGIGGDKAQQITYLSLTQYMTTTTNFAGARAATESACKSLYSTTELSSVSGAWYAVGVGSAP